MLSSLPVENHLYTNLHFSQTIQTGGEAKYMRRADWNTNMKSSLLIELACLKAVLVINEEKLQRRYEFKEPENRIKALFGYFLIVLRPMIYE
jgi:hypothetical protein